MASPMSEATSTELDLSDTLVGRVTATKYSSLASLVFLLYDHAITFEEEISLFWRRDWTFGKVLFISNRYIGLISLLADVIVIFTPSLTDEFCVHYIRWETLSLIIVLIIEGTILTSRIHAVYLCNWKVTGIIILIMFGATISKCFLDYIVIPDAAALPPGLTGCYIFNLPPHYKYTWVPALISETTQCGFMLFEAWRVYMENSNFPLLTLIIRDSFIYFLTIFSALLTNCLIWAIVPQGLAEVALGWVVAIPCTIGTRLLLNMRKRYIAENTINEPEMDIELSPGTGTGLSFVPFSDGGQEPSLFPASERDHRIC